MSGKTMIKCHRALGNATLKDRCVFKSLCVYIKR